MLNSFKAIGKTPIVALGNFAPEVKLFAKLESFNPLSSVKDRAAYGMLVRAEQRGELQAGDLIVEPTSGNTGIALAWIARLKGYPLILTMPETMSLERRRILAFLGAEIVLTEGPKGMTGAIEKAREIAEAQKAYLPNQFENPGNPEFHFETTGPEIWRDFVGKVDIAVFGVGTGGTLTGAGGYLKGKNPKLKIVAVEPAESPILSGGSHRPHKIQGIGAGFVPKILKTALIDSVETVSSDEAIAVSKALAQKEGLFVGISSGAAAAAARRVAIQNPDKVVITLFPDTAERYFSTDLFNPA
uniref:cysteine synthase n=1 Tax=Candidatus Kentrum eta TaxID=2126337 RepID=A0A450UJY2_9GAMM|nr:MAG: cysteine synthase A [Candidatus Kentron sp. H]VFJ92841.1 MAG: cysteine synthase A [Candidatus Kentron sp. H]VFJ94809.1 MAG: cysteine synthase A [Candidatus Kentron sp. H]